MKNSILILLAILIIYLLFKNNLHFILVPKWYRNSEPGISQFPFKIVLKSKDEIINKARISKWLGPPRMGQNYCQVETNDKIYTFCFPCLDRASNDEDKYNKIFKISNPFSNHVLCELGNNNELVKNKEK